MFCIRTSSRPARRQPCFVILYPLAPLTNLIATLAPGFHPHHRSLATYSAWPSNVSPSAQRHTAGDKRVITWLAIYNHIIPQRRDQSIEGEIHPSLSRIWPTTPPIGFSI